MHVIDHSTLPRIGDSAHQRFAVANDSMGCRSLEMWIEHVDCNVRIDVLPRDRQRVVVVLAGHGKLLLDGAAQAFRSPCSLVLPADSDVELVNVGAQPMHLLLAFACATPPSGDGPSVEN